MTNWTEFFLSVTISLAIGLIVYVTWGPFPGILTGLVLLVVDILNIKKTRKK